MLPIAYIRYRAYPEVRAQMTNRKNGKVRIDETVDIYAYGAGDFTRPLLILPVSRFWSRGRTETCTNTVRGQIPFGIDSI